MEDDKLDEIIAIFPDKWKYLWNDGQLRHQCIQEIRIRAGRPMMILTEKGEFVISQKGKVKRVEEGELVQTINFSQEEINRLFSYLCQESVYAYLDEIKRGYITIRGGHRVGVAGEMLSLDNGELAVRQVKYINIRIAREKQGAADELLPYVYEHQELKNTLIISPPGCGKTTILRDFIRQISDGNQYGKGKKVGVIDERYELEGNMEERNWLGLRTDVLSGCLKTKGIMMLLRSMSPDVIAVDEIGGEEDYVALEKAMHCGCKLVATMHGETLFFEKEKYDSFIKDKLGLYLRNGLFQRYVFVTKEGRPGVIRGILDENKRWLYGVI